MLWFDVLALVLVGVVLHQHVASGQVAARERMPVSVEKKTAA